MAYNGNTWNPPYPSFRKPGIIFKPEGKTGVFSVPISAVNNVHSGVPEAWTRFEKDHRIFRNTVTLDIILKRLKGLTLPSKYLFLSQVFNHPTIPQEVKTQLILKLFGGHISEAYDEEVELISYYASPDEETKEWNAKFIEAIFSNINLMHVAEDWLALACQRFIPEHAQLAMRSILKNSVMAEEEKTTFFSYFCKFYFKIFFKSRITHTHSTNSFLLIQFKEFFD